MYLMPSEGTTVPSQHHGVNPTASRTALPAPATPNPVTEQDKAALVQYTYTRGMQGALSSPPRMYVCTRTGAWYSGRNIQPHEPRPVTWYKQAHT